MISRISVWFSISLIARDLANRFPNVFLMIALAAAMQIAEAKPLSKHADNFFYFDRDGAVFYPIGANAGFLLDVSLPAESVDAAVTQLALSGINLLRVNVDDAMTQAMPVIATSKGEILPEVMERLDLIFRLAKSKEMAVALSFVDAQRMYEEWGAHPANQANGGPCSSVEDWFTNNRQRARLERRYKQLIDRYQDEDDLIWEIGRGVNVHEIDLRQQEELTKRIHFWIMHFTDLIEKADPRKHLKAISFVPNSLPFSIMDYKRLDVFFMHIRSGNPLHAALSTNKLLSYARKYTKPVFIAETTWSGEDSGREAFNRNMAWSTFAGGSGAWLSPIRAQGRWKFGDADLAVYSSLIRFLPSVALEGKPRPPAKAPIDLFPKDSYEVVDHLTGNDWVFWLARKEPGDSQAIATFNVIEGWYEFQWFDPDSGTLYPNQKRRITRKQIQMQSPEFSETLAGRLRYVKPLEKKDLEALKQASDPIKNASGEADKNDQTLEGAKQGSTSG